MYIVRVLICRKEKCYMEKSSSQLVAIDKFSVNKATDLMDKWCGSGFQHTIQIADKLDI